MTLSRWALFVFWCLVVWGTLWDASVVWSLATRGASAAAAAVLQNAPEDAFVAWANRGCGLLAIFTWIAIPLAQWSSSRKGA